MVETNYTLQQFQGRSSTSADGSGAPTAVPATGVPPPNVIAPPTGAVQGFNMGGCMGCHGNAQSKGFDFSFILQEGFTTSPETPSALEGPGAEALRAKYRNLFAR